MIPYRWLSGDPANGLKRDTAFPRYGRSHAYSDAAHFQSHLQIQDHAAYQEAKRTGVAKQRFREHMHAHRTPGMLTAHLQRPPPEPVV